MKKEKKQIIYVTGNKLKIDLLKSLLDKNEFEVIGKKMDVPEIQHDDIAEVAKFSAKYASDLLKCDVLKNDCGLVIPALNGFPSAYSKYVEQTIDSEGILALMKGKKNRECYYLDAFAYCKYGQEPIVFTQKTYGTIATRLSGKNGGPFDKFFIAKGDTKPMSHLTYKKFLASFEDSAVKELANYLKEN